MYEEHPDILTPPDQTVVWRYINLEKLVALLCDKALYFCRLDKFRDPWEGVWPKSMIDAMRSNWPAQTKHILSTLDKMKMTFFVNCWHASEYESAALWDSYAGRAGIAIKSTVGRLKSAIEVEGPFYIGKVVYCDYSKDVMPWSFNALEPAFLKRKSFEHDREVRILIWDLPRSEKEINWSEVKSYLSVAVNLGGLMEAVYLSPTAPAWLLPYVRELVKRFDLPTTPVEGSDLYAKCVY